MGRSNTEITALWAFFLRPLFFFLSFYSSFFFFFFFYSSSASSSSPSTTSSLCLPITVFLSFFLSFCLSHTHGEQRFTFFSLLFVLCLSPLALVRINTHLPCLHKAPFIIKTRIACILHRCTERRPRCSRPNRPALSVASIRVHRSRSCSNARLLLLLLVPPLFMGRVLLLKDLPCPGRSPRDHQL